MSEEDTKIASDAAEEATQKSKTVTVEEVNKSIEEMQAEIDKLTRSLANKTEESDRVHKKLEKYQREEDERKRAELSEIERITLERDSFKTEIEQLKLSEQKRKVAEAVGLPALFASRIQGGTPEEMETDARALLDAMPKVKITTTLPGGSKLPEQETPEETYKRLFGTNK